jgi:ribonuclease BN (tRNA processing enzyme)
MALKVAKSTWLFDCGEDSQRQVHRQPLIRHGKVDRIFITNRRANNILGLPGIPHSPSLLSSGLFSCKCTVI